ncbi:carbon storage regulator CsrA [Thalassotalea ponticola]|uniref:carbon storage regulator CsrA n=1 Tax=Thalassotalea ponticola TaxID=1523392 RepID=UPI0025B563EA|nr:carbon storage regulator CsrA [Thalassotalea ponticola]MDN3653606.1 carbon storage regulator CsrA [Thalassotalea ponticola]
MLILIRKIGQTIHIGNNIACKIILIQGEQVKIGIDAPEAVSVHRSEINKRIKSEIRA